MTMQRREFVLLGKQIQGMKVVRRETRAVEVDLAKLFSWRKMLGALKLTDIK